jgi:hypothetical protein
MCELGECCKKASQKICNDSFSNDIDSLVITFLEFPSSQFFNGAQTRLGYTKGMFDPKSFTKHYFE